jgi:hypothetical protein
MTIRRSTTPARLEPAKRANDGPRGRSSLSCPGKAQSAQNAIISKTSLFTWAGPREDIDRRQRCLTEMVKYNAMLAEVPDTWPLPT